MGRSSRKPRQKKLDPNKVSLGPGSEKKKEQDWTFDDIVRSKSRRR